MFESRSYVNPTPLAHVDTSRDVLPRGELEGVFVELLELEGVFVEPLEVKGVFVELLELGVLGEPLEVKGVFGKPLEVKGVFVEPLELEGIFAEPYSKHTLRRIYLEILFKVDQQYRSCKAWKLLGAVDTRRYPRAENRVWSDQEDHEERKSKDRAEALVDPTVTRSTIRADVGIAIVPQTISRHLAEANLKSECPFRALPLTPEHRQLRLQWCQARSMWNVTDRQKVVFSDEFRFALGTNDNRVRVWRHPGPFLNGLTEAIFQQDNARPHTARFAQDFLRHFQTLPRPAAPPICPL
ncbi:transposable element Tcb2 transposase [Trichonephila clavipes]|nr:transposable element Tcb2 transposase [Trichonephila clavipes]